MKKWLTFIFLIVCLIDFCYVRGFFLYAQYSNDGDEDISLRVWSLKQDIQIEEDAIKSLRDRYRHVVKEKIRVQKVIEREKERVMKIENGKGLNQRALELKRQREQERQLILLEQIMRNHEEKKKFLERIEQKRAELLKQKQEHEKKLSEEENRLQELELELMNQQEQKRIEMRDYGRGNDSFRQREIEMQRQLEEAGSKI